MDQTTTADINAWAKWLAVAIEATATTPEKLADAACVGRSTIYAQLAGARPSGPSASRIIDALALPAVARERGWAAFRATVRADL